MGNTVVASGSIPTVERLEQMLKSAPPKRDGVLPRTPAVAAGVHVHHNASASAGGSIGDER